MGRWEEYRDKALADPDIRRHYEEIEGLSVEDEAVLDEIWAGVAYVVEDDLAQVVTNENPAEYQVEPTSFEETEETSRQAS
jgi:hypothetical protein